MSGLVLWENGGNVPPVYPNEVTYGFRASSEYGMRWHPIDKVWRLHAGLDTIGYAIVCAPEDGYLKTGYSGGYGNLATVTAGFVEHRLAHNSRFLRGPGWVKAGEQIAVMGTTGASTGVHCHHEVRVNGRLVNPREYMASVAGGGATPITPVTPSEEDTDMRAIKLRGAPDSGIIIQAATPPSSLNEQVFNALVGGYRLVPQELEDWQYGTCVREQWAAANSAAALSGSKLRAELVDIVGDSTDEIVKAIADRARAGQPLESKLVLAA